MRERKKNRESEEYRGLAFHLKKIAQRAIGQLIINGEINKFIVQKLQCIDARSKYTYSWT